MSNLISIIIPVHNVEPYLSQCLSSLQAIKPVTDGGEAKTEFIIIDDKSTDRSGDIAEEFAAQDKRFKVYHASTNVGSSASRNAGLEFAKGNYIGFVDSDDYVDENYLSLLYENLIKNDADICVCNYLSREKPAIARCSEAVFIGEDILSEYIAGGIYNRIFNKLYTRDVIGDVKFPVGRDMTEDGVWTPKVLFNAKRICRINIPLYHYRVRSGSICRSGFSFKKRAGYWMNVAEHFFGMFANINKPSDLKILSSRFFRDFPKFLASNVYGVKEIFVTFKITVVDFQSKIRPHVAPNSREEKILNLLLTEDDINVVKQELIVKEASP